MNKEQQDRAMFVSFCIEQYAKAKNMATEDVVNLFEQYGIMEVLRKLRVQRYVSQTVLSTMALASTQPPLTNRLRNG